MVFTETYNNKYTGLDTSFYPQGLQNGVWAGVSLLERRGTDIVCIHPLSLVICPGCILISRPMTRLTDNGWRWKNTAGVLQKWSEVKQRKLYSMKKR